MTDLIFGLIGGLGFFFYGMKIMSEGLKKVAGDNLKKILHKVTNVPIVGVLVGTLITILIQSSSATTVMVVGFVNAGLLTLKQAICVVVGANIGTTFTAWLVSFMSIFKITKYALPAVGIGFFLMSMSKRINRQNWGQVLLGFGILFIGLSFMKDAFTPLKNSEALHDIFAYFSVNPLLGVLVGIVFTILLQSSSATIAIVQVLAFNGVISFEAAVPIILGDNIGTTITAQLAAIGANLNARRAAMSHTLFNVIGVAYMLIFVQIGLFGKLIDFIVPGEINTTNIMFVIAVSHSFFNVANTIIFLPFINLLEKVSIRFVPHKEDSVDYETKYLEPHLLNTPTIAVEQIHREIVYMLKIARKTLNHAIPGFIENNLKEAQKTCELEDVTDSLQADITQYIVKLSQKTLSTETSRSLPILIHNVNDLERIGDYCKHMAELTKIKVGSKLTFSDDAMKEINLMCSQINEMFEETKVALETRDINVALKILEREKKIDELQETFKHAHIDRLNAGKCDLNAGFIFLDIIDSLEKIGDRLTNLAKSVRGKKYKLEAEESV